MKKAVLSVLAALLVFSLFGCGQNPAEEAAEEVLKEPEEPKEVLKEPEEPKESTNPYLSIGYVRNSAENPEEKEKVMLCYDINTEKLTEVCVLPKENHIVSATYSRANNAVYYFGNTDKNDYYSECGIWKYDVAAKETLRLDDENHSYNELKIIDENTLLLMMVTNEHPIMPVLFDIESKTFTYMADANNEPFVYTCGPLSLSYNHATEELACIYWSEEDVDRDYNSFKKPINYYLSAADKNLVKDPERTFSYSSKINENNFWHAVQLSENEYIVAMYSGVPSDEPMEYYSLVFGDGEPSFTKTECPYPHADYLWNLQTIDGGKTFYFYLRSDDLGNPSGIYSYVPETEELSPIILYDPEIAPEYVGFSLIEDGSKPLPPAEELAEKIDPKAFITFEEITALGCYPVWMQPNTTIIYDENGKPEIIEGGVLTEEDCAENEMYSEIGFIYPNDKIYRIKPNTKVEYFKDGFIQNIYFRWPDGSYNLSPLSQTENAKITYYATIEDWENESGETVVLSEDQCHSVFWIFDDMNLLPESTSKPMDFPRYKITFTYVGTEHCIYVDANNVFTSTMLDGGNYVSTFDENHFSKTEKLFNEAE